MSGKRARRERQERRAGPAAPAGPATPAGPRGPAASWVHNPLVLVPLVVLLVAAGIGAGVGVSRWYAGSPGAPPTGGAAGGRPASGPAGFELEVLRGAAAREDAPVESLLKFAHVALDQGRLGEALRTYERVLARDPRNAEAINHVGAVHYAEERVDEALAKVEEALRVDPTYIHALWDRVQYLYHGKRDYPGTVRAGEAFLAVLPQGPDADNIRKLMDQARARAGPGAR